MSETITKSIAEMSVVEIQQYLASIKEAEVAKLKSENDQLLAKVAENNKSIASITGKVDSGKTGTKVKRNTREAIEAVLNGNLMTPPEIVEAICAGTIFNSEGLDNKNKLLYVHTTLADKSKFMRVDDKYTLITK